MEEVRWDGPDWKKRIEKVGFRGVIECGLAIEAQAKDFTTVDTGRLRDSISTAVGRDEVIVGTNVEYAPYVEYGTSRNMAQPYLRPAVDLVAGRAVQIVQKEGKREFTGYDD